MVDEALAMIVIGTSPWQLGWTEKARPANGLEEDDGDDDRLRLGLLGATDTTGESLYAEHSQQLP